MYRVCLVNPPYAAINAPSFALTQLQELLVKQFDAEQLSVSLHYFNIDFAQYLGADLYNFVAGSMDALHSGLGEWFFRRVAFPDAADNTDDYYGRYRTHLNSAQSRSKWKRLLDKRAGTEEVLTELIARHGLAEANLLGLTTMFQQSMAGFAIARLLKQRNPEVVVVIGGANCESPMGEEIARNVPSVDYVFSGPALVNFPQFVGLTANGKEEEGAALDGVLSRRTLAIPEAPSQCGSAASLTVISLAPVAAAAPLSKSAIGRELDIDYQFELNYEPFLETMDKAFGSQVTPILFFETSRGCWWGQKAHCTFCGLNGSSMTYRAMRADLAREQFGNLFQYSGRVAELQAVDNILPRSYLTDVLPFLATPRGLRIFYEVKADLTEEDIKTIAKAGVAKIQPGIESLATSTLKLMRKGTTAYQNIRFLKWCGQHRVEPAWNLLIGFPGEQEDVYRKYAADIPLLTHLPPPYGVFPIRFDRFSPYYVRASEYQLQLKPLDFYSLAYPFPEESLEKMAYFFADENVDAPYALAASTWISSLSEKVKAWRALWYCPGVEAPPILRFESETSTFILDTRFGEEQYHDVGDEGRTILDSLSVVQTRERLETVFEGSGIDVGLQLKTLTENGLLFEENGRYLSLLVPQRHGDGEAVDAVREFELALA